MFHLLCTDFVKYNFVFDWHVHWYVCTAVIYQLYHYKLILICNSIWFSTCHFIPNLAPRTSPKHYFLCQVTLTFLQKNVVLLWYEKSLLKTCTFISLHERYVCRIQGSKMHRIFFVNRPFLSSTTDDLLQISLSSLMFGDNIYVGYVLKVPPVSYFLYIK